MPDEAEGFPPEVEPGTLKVSAADKFSPERIMVAGDWHRNSRWAQQVIGKAQMLLASEEYARIIVHCGDFGIWGDRAGALYIDTVSRALERVEADLYFVDGNHEDFGILDRHGRAGKAAGFPTCLSGAFDTDVYHVKWMWRGYRWTWHDRTWLALGGAVSPDRAVRTEGVDWFPQEEITDEQAAAVIAAGPADVLVCHDCPPA